MNWLDIVIIVVLAASTFGGLRTGIIKSVLSLAGLIVGIVLAGLYYVPLSEQLTFISQATLAKAVAFIIILVGVGIVAAVLARVLKWLTSLTMLAWVDRLGGAFFGLLVAALFCSLGLALWVKFLGMADTILASGLARVLLDRLPMVLALLPEEFDAVSSFFY